MPTFAATRFPILGLIPGVAGVLCACSLNPQPLPPDNGDDSGASMPASGETPDAAQSTGRSDAGHRRDASTESDVFSLPLDAGTGETGAGDASFSSDARDAEPDAWPDANVDRGDVETEVTVDAPLEATLAVTEAGGG